MQSKALTPNEYIEELPEERKEAFSALRRVILENLPTGFSEEMNYGMIGYVVPHSIYPAGYHCDPSLPLPFLNIASQKNFIGLYHMGIYSNPKLLNWFTSEYPKYCTQKLDMGKSCIRFKKMDQIPYELIKQLVQKITPEDWVKDYQKSISK